SAQYRFDHWTTENGLPQNSVLAITQTSDGYLWLTTFNGLVRFDGVRFTVFDRQNTLGIGINRCTDLYEDATGALWIGTIDGGVIRYQIWRGLQSDWLIVRSSDSKLQTAQWGAEYDPYND